MCPPVLKLTEDNIVTSVQFVLNWDSQVKSRLQPLLTFAVTNYYRQPSSMIYQAIVGHWGSPAFSLAQLVRYLINLD